MALISDTAQNVVDASKRRRLFARAQQIIKQMGALGELDAESLAERYKSCRERLPGEKGRAKARLIDEVMALVAVAVERTYGFTLYPVQIASACAMLRDGIIEVATGEGKTVVAMLASACLVADGRAVHVATANDYLAERDGLAARKVLDEFGIRVAYLIGGTPQHLRRIAYGCDIVYATVQQLGFDYLRDHIAVAPGQRVQQGHEFLLVDEADAVMLDEASTPMIISEPNDEDDGAVAVAQEWADEFEIEVVQREDDMDKARSDIDGYAVSDTKSLYLLTSGYEKMEALAQQIGGIDRAADIYYPKGLPLLAAMENAIKAKWVYERDVDYLVSDGEVVLIDSHTGRTLPGRQLSEGIHQAIEAKESLPVSPTSRTMAEARIMDYVALYEHCAGMTGTGVLAREPFSALYGLNVLAMPTAKPMIRDDQIDRIYLTRDARDRAIIEDVRACVASRQPVLIGTLSIDESERISRLLDQNGIAHSVLNAKQHRREAEIVAEAGKPGQVTIATSMAGRGTDIILGGHKPEDPESLSAWQQRHACVVDAGGLRVIGVSRHRSRRVDHQLRGRAGRQGDPGSSVFYLSLEDELLLSNIARPIHNLARQLDISGDEGLSHKWISSRIEEVQERLSRDDLSHISDSNGFDETIDRQRRQLYALRDEWMETEDPVSQIGDCIHSAIDAMIDHFCPPGDSPEKWNFEAFLNFVRRHWGIEVELGENEDYDLRRIREAILSSFGRMRERALAAGCDDMGEPEARFLLLTMLDSAWQMHISAMDALKRYIPFVAYVQLQPGVEFQRESYEAFGGMLNVANNRVAGAWMLFFNKSMEQARPEDDEPVAASVRLPEEERSAARDTGQGTA